MMVYDVMVVLCCIRQMQISSSGSRTPGFQLELDLDLLLDILKVLRSSIIIVQRNVTCKQT
jgi:hypothetical protein